MAKPREITPVDGGYAWVILAASTLLYMTLVGGLKAFGILYTEFLEKYDAGAGNTAWISSVLFFLNMGLGPLANHLASVYSFRKVVMVGGLLLTTGYFVSAFVPRMEWMYLTIGVIGGVGSGLSFVPCSTIVSFYFAKRRALANGIMVSGSGVGSFVFPYLYRYSIDEYGLQGSLIIISGLMLHICVAGALLREPHLMDSEQEQSKEHTDEEFTHLMRSPSAEDMMKEQSAKENTQLRHSPNTEDMVKELPAKSKTQLRRSGSTEKIWREKPSTPKQKGIIMNSCSVCNPRLSIYVVVFTLNVFTHAANFSAFPAHVKALGFDKQQVTVALSIIGATEVFSRPFFGWFADLKLVSYRTILIFVIAVSAVAAIVLPHVTAYPFMLVYGGVVGIFPGAFTSLLAVVVLECVTFDNFSAAMGLLYMSMACGIIVSQPTAGDIMTGATCGAGDAHSSGTPDLAFGFCEGWLEDATGTWSLSFYVLGIINFLICAILLMEPFILKCWCRDQDDEVPVEDKAGDEPDQLMLHNDIGMVQSDIGPDSTCDGDILTNNCDETMHSEHSYMCIETERIVHIASIEHV